MEDTWREQEGMRGVEEELAEVVDMDMDMGMGMGMGMEEERGVSFAHPYVAADGETKYSLPPAAYPPPGAVPPPVHVRVWVDEFTSWDVATQLVALYTLITSLSLTLLTALTAWLPLASKRDFVAELPGNIVRSILLYLDMRTLAKATQVSRAWRARAEDQQLWEGYCKAGWPMHVRARLVAQEEARALAASASDAADSLVFWKDVFRERYVVDAGWERGLFAQSVLADAVPRRCFDFDDDVVARSGKIVSGGFTSVYVTDLYSGERMSSIDTHHSSWIYSLRYSTAFDVLVTGCWDGLARVFSLSSGKCLAQLEGHKGGVWSIAPDFAGNKVVSASNDATLRVWDMNTTACLNVLQGHASGVYDVQLVNDGVLSSSPLVISASADYHLKMWDMRASGREACVATFKGHSDVVSCCQVDGTTMFSGSHDGLVKAWDLAAGKSAPVANFTGALHRIKCLQFDDAKLVAGSTDGTVRLWNRRDVKLGSGGGSAYDNAYEPMYTLYGHTSEVSALGFNDNKLVTASRDNTLRVWSVVADSGLIAEHEAAKASLSAADAAAIRTALPENPNPLSLSVLVSDSPGKTPSSPLKSRMRPSSASPSRRPRARPSSGARPQTSSGARRRHRDE
ncbi:F-box/WD repeat-containing protein 7 [Thecamonas trahens ATCC 50062]|uniref:F-box/WD repeat-containing protein 7 n=1 Tax=Thecamonas trahens ATCC 50062 TaxID=461836 RepID=A0A0L0DIE2_THETB|nr:F-box/WD repeat-containing protein 7 [Thecamonas trahens ATCC 50062]KNC51073.1 F-box/WD repeat-containing protein 7 [Thecamonas trahens ATCC 50062]|eukprot:XP_013756532.1 F-box/WD repeat-containing protein 7 [Thecamonas trahens ATCC 50062]